MSGDIYSAAVDTDGTRSVCTASALYAITPNGMKSLIASHTTEKGFEDGEGTEARVCRPHSISVDGEVNVLVADT